MKKKYLAAIAIVAFSTSMFATDVMTQFTIKNVESNRFDPNQGLVYAYLIRTVEGREFYVQGYDCAMEYVTKHGAAIVGGKHVKGNGAMMCLTLD